MTSNILHEHTTGESRSQETVLDRRRVPAATRAAGGFFLAMGGVHLGIVGADPETYRHFADGALFGFVRTGWLEVFMAAPAVWGLLLAAGEMLLGALLLHGGPAARAGWLGVVVFHVLLLLFGWGFWLWSVPAVFVLVRGARRDWRTLGVPAASGRPRQRAH